MRPERPSPLRWLRRLMTRASAPPAQHPGTLGNVVLPEALVALEARAADRLVEASSSGHAPVAGAGHGPTWINALGRPTRVVVAPGPIEALTEAIGLASTGLRVAVFVDFEQLPALALPLSEAARRLAPLVVYALGGTPGGRSPAACLAAIADSGAAVVVPGSAQEAVDLALAARLLAERAMGPVVIALLLPVLGSAHVPDDAALAAVLGAPDDPVDPSSDVQRALLGAGRDRLSAWFDPDHPVAQGLPAGHAHDAVARAARAELVGTDRIEVLGEVLAAVGAATGRALTSVHGQGMDGAKAVIVAQGPAAAAAKAVLAGSRTARVGVLSVPWLRPFPASEVAAALDGRRVAVLELADPPHGGRPPLFRELAAAANARGWVSAVVGDPRLGLAPDRLEGLAAELVAGRLPPVVRLDAVGDDRTGWPKRDALLDAAGTAHRVPAVPFARAASRSGALGLVCGDDLPGSALASLATAVDDVAGVEVWLGQGLRLAVAGAGAHAGTPLSILVVEGPLARVPVEVLAATAPGAVVVHEGEVPPRWGRALHRRGSHVVRIDGARLDRLRAAIALESAPAAVTGDPEQGRLPEVVRRIATAREAPDSLPRFWGAVLEPALADGSDGRLDPIAASGAVPSGTAALAPPVEAADLPEFDADACTACGACWPACPDAAIGVAVLGVAELLTGASEAAGTKGREADAVRRAHKPLASRLSRTLRDGETRVLHADAVRTAWEWLAPKLDVAADAHAAHDDAVRRTAAVVDGLAPVAGPDLFHAREAEAKGTGELLVLAFDPSTCQGCGLCVAACPEAALAAEPRTEARIDEAQGRWRALQALPDTAGASLEPLAAVLGPMAAALTSRHVARAQLGGVAGDPGSGERLALRLVTALVERHAQPRLAELGRQLDRARTELETRLRDRLTDAIADVDVERLAGALAEGTDARAALRELAAHLDRDGVSVAVDRRRAGQLARHAADLRTRHERVVRGPDGLGRARFGLVLAGAPVASRLAPWPYNPWWAPVAVADPGGAADLARGLAGGLAARHLDDVRALRRAALLAAQPADLDDRLEALGGLGWSDLDAAERAACPVTLLVGDEASLRSSSGALAAVLGCDLPVKLVLLDGLSDPEATVDALWVALGGPGAAVMSHVGAADHLASGTLAALAHPGPALLHLHAPSPQRHGFATDATLEVARAATARRAHPLLVCAPGPGSLATRLELAGNPVDAAADTSAWAQARWETLQELAGIGGPVAGRVRESVAAELAAERAAEVDAVRRASEVAMASVQAGSDTAAIARLTERFLSLAGYGRGEG